MWNGLSVINLANFGQIALGSAFVRKPLINVGCRHLVNFYITITLSSVESLVILDNHLWINLNP